MREYAYMAWDTNFSYFCDNWRKTEFLLTSDSGKKHPNLLLTTQTTRPCNVLVGAGAWDSPTVLQTQQPQQLDDVAR